MKETEVQLTDVRTLCRFHAVPFLPRWPLALGDITQRLWNAASNTIPPYNGFEDFDEYTKAHCRWVEKHLDEKPLCCRLETINVIHLGDIYESIPIFISALCTHCKKWKIGAPLPLKRAIRTHLCFGCYLERRNHG